MAINDELGGPLHNYLENAFGALNERLSDVRQEVSDLKSGINARGIEIQVLQARLSTHETKDEKVLSELAENLGKLNLAEEVKKARWAGPRELLTWVAVILSPILGLVLAAWNPFQPKP